MTADIQLRGMPSALRLAPIVVEHAPGTYPAGVPIGLQRVALAAALGRRLR